MTHYIDKDALVAEIDKRQSILDIDSPFGIGGMIELELIKDILGTLEVKEVDLEKEIDEWCNKCISDYELEGWVGMAIQNVAKHFFELGLKAKQEDKLIMEKTTEIPFGAKDSELKGWEYTIPEGMEAEIKDGKIIVKEKESEDENIRKVLINIVKGACDKYGIKYQGKEITEEKLLAWLEKQGVNISSFPKEQQAFMQKYVSLDKITLIKLLAERDVNNAEIIESFEKQGKQNLVNIDYISGIRKGLLDIENNAENINGLTESQWVAIRAAHSLLGEYIAKVQNPAWGKEDEIMMQYVYHSIDANVSDANFKKIRIWFKTLKERCAWKPSNWKPSKK